MSDTLLLTDRAEPKAQLCPRCEADYIKGNDTMCADCVEEFNEQGDGQWCFSRDAGCWHYE
jgi:uncharacterized Zn ribbon protein